MTEKLSAEDVRRMMDEDPDLVVVDALGEASYAKQHLPGAVNVPAESPDLEERVGGFVPDKATPVVVYCAGPACHASPKVARRMRELGYTDVREFSGGLEAWHAAGLPFERAHGARAEAR